MQVIISLVVGAPPWVAGYQRDVVPPRQVGVSRRAGWEGGRRVSRTGCSGRLRAARATGGGRHQAGLVTRGRGSLRRGSLRAQWQ